MNSATSGTGVLEVDDEPDLLTLYELTLLREGHEVETASTVAEAWEALQGKVYKLVITDMRLPDGTGMDLLKRLEAARRPERTIVITAYGSTENAVEALKVGAFDYLTKPVDLKQFRTVVSGAMGQTATPLRSAVCGAGTLALSAVWWAAPAPCIRCGSWSRKWRAAWPRRWCMASPARAKSWWPEPFTMPAHARASPLWP